MSPRKSLAKFKAFLIVQLQFRKSILSVFYEFKDIQGEAVVSETQSCLFLGNN